jgi:AmmeMemoRadiSam system protein A
MIEEDVKMLTEMQGRILLKLARQTIEERLGQIATDPVPPDELNDPGLREHRGVFVTLNKRGALRGCIGSLLGVESILDGVRRHAVNAALHDHRFPMVTGDEVAELQIDISVLTPPQNLEYKDGEDLVWKLRPHVDGVILKVPGGAGATFLPQVWDQLPIEEMFLDHLCLKAGLPKDSWRSGELTVQTYQVQHFEERV